MFRNILIIFLSASFALSFVSCNTTAIEEKKEVKIKLGSISNEPETIEQAVLERQGLLEDINALLTAMLGGNFADENNPEYREIVQDYYEITRGIARLEAEKSEYGFSFYRDINAFLKALKRHLILLDKIKNKLDFVPEFQIQPENNQTNPN